jgi:hypothetical protein
MSAMKAFGSLAIAAIVATSATGCFTTWVAIRAAGYPGAVDEDVKEQRVPLPGIDEKLVVSLAPEQITPSGVVFSCHADQHGRDATYRASFRYGRRWKTTTAIMFIAEAAMSAVFLLTEPKDEANKPLQILGGVFFGIDALGTGVLFFAPRKELYGRTDTAVTTEIRAVCPEGVMVEIAGETFPLDAAGSLGELGNAAFDQWMGTPNGAILVTFAGRSAMIDVSDADRCVWQRLRSAAAPTATAPPPAAATPSAASYAPGAASACGTVVHALAAVIDLPVGTLGVL